MKTEVRKALRKAHLHESYWGKKILAAEKRCWFTDNNKKQASVWTTCACGHIDSRIPRSSPLNHCDASSPLDSELKYAGLRFYNQINENNFMGATYCLIEIEARAREILK